MHHCDSEQHSDRRCFLQTAGLSALSLFCADWQQVQARAPSRSGKARSVIMIFNAGAPSHLDLWDLKPDAPSDVRGEYRPIATATPGIQISELLPRLARQSNLYSIVRTVHHRHGGHNSGMYWSIVGRPYRIDSTLINPSRSDYPSFGTLVGWLARRDGYSGALPPYVITPFPHCDSTAYITPGQYGGCLGAAHDPFVLNANPNAADFRVQTLTPAKDLNPTRMQGRRELFDRLGKPGTGDFASNHERGFHLVQSAEVRRAFDLSSEPAAVRERYGRHPWGQSHLLARRLIEAGVRFVSTVNGPSISWDTHENNFTRLKNQLVPPMELAFSTLLEDLQARGLLDSTLVVWMGDFGRTPRINAKAGRDHWPQCYSMVLAGGGIRGGQVIGVSDRQAAFPKDFPITPADIHATVFQALGYDPHAESYLSPEGRPFPLSEGRVIDQLL